MNTRDLAIYTAGRYHLNQMYDTDKPYVYHLEAVDSVLADFGLFDVKPVRIAAWLHDILEDCPLMDKPYLEKLFGVYISEIVWRVTDEPGANRKERKRNTYPKISELDDAVALKLADRIANLEYGIKTGSSKVSMYVEESPSFQTGLDYGRRRSAVVASLWNRYFAAIYEGSR